MGLELPEQGRCHSAQVLSKWWTAEKIQVDGGFPLLLLTAASPFVPSNAGNPSIPSDRRGCSYPDFRKALFQPKRIDQSHAVSKAFWFLLE